MSVEDQPSHESRALRSIALILAAHEELMCHIVDCAAMLPDEQSAFVAQQVGNISHQALILREVLHLPETPGY